MGETELLVEDHTAAALLIQVFVLVLGLHMLPRENALFKLKINAVLAEDLREDMALNLIDIIEDGIAENEVPFVSGMSVQVQVHEELLIFIEMLAQLHHGVTGRLLHGVWVLVIAVEVLIKSVHSAVPV